MSKELGGILTCECSSLEHIVVFTYWEDEKDVYLSVHLKRLPLLKRIVYAVKYIFGYQCKYGAFDEIILGSKNYDRIMQIAEHIKADEK